MAPGGPAHRVLDSLRFCLKTVLVGRIFLAALASAVHLLSLAGGVSILLLRWRALAGPLDEGGVRRVLALDNLSGLIALTWIGSGLWRLFGGLEKGTDYYLHNHVFWAKMGLLGVAWGCEMLPMITFLRWRRQLAEDQPADLTRVSLLRKLHGPELVCVLLIVPLASLMARGVGAPTSTAQTPTGELVYQARCVSCHQADGRGLQGRVAADFVGDKTRLRKSDEVLLRSVEDGIPGTAMRGFRGETTDEERRAVVQFLRQRFGER